MKIGVMMMCFNAPHIHLAIANAYPHVDVIYVGYSKYSWNYKHKIENKISRKELENSVYKDKIVIVDGEWTKDDEERNAILEHAKKDGCDFIIIQDADEFYIDSEYKKMIRYIATHDYPVYTCKMYYFRKGCNILLDEKGNYFYNNPEIAINLKYDVSFKNCRITDTQKKINIVGVTCYHMSYCLDDEMMLKKIQSRGHAHEIVKGWYENKRLGWTYKTRNLHPVSPTVWSCAAEYTFPLPNAFTIYHI